MSPGEVIVETWGQILRAQRERQGLSLAALAVRAHVDKSTVSKIESGSRHAKVDFARACDEALGTSPLLVTLLGTHEGDNMRRRALISAAGLATGAGALGVTPLANLVRQRIWESASTDVDYDAVVAQYARQFVIHASEAFGASLVAQLLVWQHMADHDDPSPDLLRAIARLAEIYGLWRGNGQDFAGAANWYTTAIMLAEQSGDTVEQQYILARTANRRLFEGAGLADVRCCVDQALALVSGPTPGRVEAHAARVCMSALAGDATGGKRALADMARDVERLTSSHVPNLPERTSLHAAYLAARVGTLAQAEAACHEALVACAGLPYWHLEARLYLARALVVAGGVSDGLAIGVTALRSGPDAIGVIRVAARDIVMAVPSTWLRSDELTELKAYASLAPGPWET